MRLRILTAGVCGTDVHIWEGRISFASPPIVLGHEFVGVVEECGPDVRRVKPGDRVSADACWRCGECKACLEGRYNQCIYSGSIGLSSDGAFAPLVRFPAYCAVPLPDSIPDDVGALLEPLAVGLHALDRGHARAGERVVVIGYGPVGAATAPGCRPNIV